MDGIETWSTTYEKREQCERHEGSGRLELGVSWYGHGPSHILWHRIGCKVIAIGCEDRRKRPRRIRLVQHPVWTMYIADQQVCMHSL